jgi:thermitase
MRGGQAFQTVVLDPVDIDGQLVRPGSVIVRFKAGTTSTQQAEAHRAVQAVEAKPLRLPRASRIEVRPGEEKRAVAAYRARADVEYAQLDGFMTAFYVPDDTRFGEMWGMTKIRAPEAWDVTRSSNTVKIAILDTGIYGSNSEREGPDGVVGHADLRTKVVLHANLSTASTTDDFLNHGTHVAGTAAATTNNGTGVVGVGHDAVILNGKVLDDLGGGSDSTIVNGIVWAADNGAHVINLSLGYYGPCSAAIQDAVNYAWARGSVIVVAAGNNGSTPGSNLTLCDNTLSVGATDQMDAKASFSSWGPAVDVAAPGVDILSTNRLGTYSSFSGTSMASPHVAGLAALVWASGATTNAEVVSKITSTSVTTASTGVHWTYGRVDARAAVEPPPPPPPPEINWAANNSTDFNGDHMTDFGLYRGRTPLDSLWYSPGSGGATAFQIYFGDTSDVPVPGDYNGDGNTDAVIYRPATGLWYGPQTGAAAIVIQMILGEPGDIPIPGDYDGDGKTDPAIFRPSTGLFFGVKSGGGVLNTSFGGPNDIPVPRDYDGDGKTDPAIYRANVSMGLGLWYSVLSGGGVYQIYFGDENDIPVPGDYNGDRKAEAVIFRETTGLWYGPYNGAPGLFQLLLGGPGDVPIPGYYDDNLATDPAIYRKATGLWFAWNSGGGVTRIDGLGDPTDVPVQKRPALAGGV